MNYMNLGATGTAGVQGVPGDDGIRERQRPPWVIDEDAAEPIVRRAVEGGVTFFDTADTYSGGASEVATGAPGVEVPQPRRGRDRDQGVHADDAGGERRRPARKHILSGIDASACAASAWTTSTSTRSIAGTTRRPSRRRWRALHDVVRAGKARYIGAQLDVRLAVRQGAAQRRAARLDAIRLDAGPLQPHLPRGGARDAPPVPRPGDRRASPGARWHAASWPALGPATVAATPPVRARTRSPTTSTTNRLTSMSWTRWPRVAAARGVPSARSPSPGCWPSRE